MKILTFKKVLMLALGVCLLGGCARTDIRIQGTVTSAKDVKPIAGATVEFLKEGWSSSTVVAVTTTNDQGRYTLEYTEKEDCSEMLMNVRVRATGFRERYINDLFHQYIRCSEEIQNIDIQLTPM